MVLTDASAMSLALSKFGVLDVTGLLCTTGGDVNCGIGISGKMLPSFSWKLKSNGAKPTDSSFPISLSMSNSASAPFNIGKSSSSL
jgi:hypothetical protein